MDEQNLQPLPEDSEKKTELDKGPLPEGWKKKIKLDKGKFVTVYTNKFKQTFYSRKDLDRYVEKAIKYEWSFYDKGSKQSTASPSGSPRMKDEKSHPGVKDSDLSTAEPSHPRGKKKKSQSGEASTSRSKKQKKKPSK